MSETITNCNIFKALQKEQDQDLKSPITKTRLFEFKELNEEEYFKHLALMLTGGMA